jgi:hypothetical protein
LASTLWGGLFFYSNQMSAKIYGCQNFGKTNFGTKPTPLEKRTKAKQQTWQQFTFGHGEHDLILVSDHWGSEVTEVASSLCTNKYIPRWYSHTSQVTYANPICKRCHLKVHWGTQVIFVCAIALFLTMSSLLIAYLFCAVALIFRLAIILDRVRSLRKAT